MEKFGDLFSKYICTGVNRFIAESTFVNADKKAEVRSIYKKDGTTKKSNYRPISVFQMFSKSIKNAYTSKYIPILIKHFPKTNAFENNGFS